MEKQDLKKKYAKRILKMQKSEGILKNEQIFRSKQSVSYLKYLFCFLDNFPQVRKITKNEELFKENTAKIKQKDLLPEKKTISFKSGHF